MPVSGSSFPRPKNRMDLMALNGTIVLVAKCPIPGKSKTRLIPRLGAEGSVAFAKAMLSDVLASIAEYPPLATVDKILLYAPGDSTGAAMMKALLKELNLLSIWKLMPVSAAASSDLTSSYLGSLLQDALVRVAKKARKKEVKEEGDSSSSPGMVGSIVFIGMDAPEVPLDELCAAFEPSTAKNTALLCPAADGGYGLLSLPESVVMNSADAKVFEGIRWSNPLTAISQLKAVTDAGASVRIGRLMYDIDEPDDVSLLCHRLRRGGHSDRTDDCLSKPSQGGMMMTGNCFHTRKILSELGLL